MRTVAGSPDSRRIRIALPAVYNIYNAAAAVAASIAVNIPLEDACGSLSTVKSSFGRLETFDLNGIRLQMILVKNPAGCNQAFSYVTGLNEDYTAVLCLNNRTGDGHDISWIASTDYEKLCADPHLKKIYVAGDCAQALSERLKEAGAVSEDEERMEVITDYDEIVSRLKSEGRTAFLLPNYTSMMELRQALSKETGSRDFWE
jgi:UDP-N-acetylmuramyl tripeptide synthase